MRGLVSEGRILQKDRNEMENHPITHLFTAQDYAQASRGSRLTPNKDMHMQPLLQFVDCGYPQVTHCKPHKANQRTRISRPGHNERGEVIPDKFG